MNEPPSKLIASVCCMAGLPGSGKSSLARRIIDLHEQERRNWPSCTDSKHDHDAPGISRFDQIHIVDYDSITQQELTLCNCGIEGAKNDNLDTQNTSFDSNDLEAWRNSRVRALEILKDALTKHFTGDGDASSLLILMDDNFHLRSMRRDVYRSCQEMLAMPPLKSINERFPIQIGFSTVYFSTPVEVCLQRNNSRSGKERIPVDVINRMASAMETPDESKPYASFERFHVSIDNLDNEIILSEIDQCIHKSIQSPILPKKEISQEEIAKLEQQRIQQQEETLKCQMQRIDQLLRKLVGAVGRVEKKRSREANEIRKSIMERIRKQDDVVEMSDECVVQLFACSILDVEVNSAWLDLDNPLAQSIKYTVQEVQQDRSKVS